MHSEAAVLWGPTDATDNNSIEKEWAFRGSEENREGHKFKSCSPPCTLSVYYDYESKEIALGMNGVGFDGIGDMS